MVSTYINTSVCNCNVNGQTQHQHHFNIIKANATPLRDCNVIKPNATSVNDLTSVRHNNSTSSVTRQCNIKTLLERQSSRVTLTCHCKVLRYWDVKIADQPQHVNPTSIRCWKVKFLVQRQHIMQR